MGMLLFLDRIRRKPGVECLRKIRGRGKPRPKGQGVGWGGAGVQYALDGIFADLMEIDVLRQIAELRVPSNDEC